MPIEILVGLRWSGLQANFQVEDNQVYTTCGAKAQKTRGIPPGLFNVVLQSHTVITLDYH